TRLGQRLGIPWRDRIIALEVQIHPHLPLHESEIAAARSYEGKNLFLDASVFRRLLECIWLAAGGWHRYLNLHPRNGPCLLAHALWNQSHCADVYPWVRRP